MNIAFIGEKVGARLDEAPVCCPPTTSSPTLLRHPSNAGWVAIKDQEASIDTALVADEGRRP